MEPKTAWENEGEDAERGNEEGISIHGRSGRVTLLRMKVVLAGLTSLGMEERVCRAERVDEGRRSMEAILN